MARIRYKDRCHYIVNYGVSTARFSDMRDAFRFAEMVSRPNRIWSGEDFHSEVRAKKHHSKHNGIIAQFEDGEPTAEFLSNVNAVLYPD